MTALEKPDGKVLAQSEQRWNCPPPGPNHHLTLYLPECGVWSTLSLSLPRTHLQPQLCHFPSGQVLCSPRASVSSSLQWPGEVGLRALPPPAGGLCPTGAQSEAALGLGRWCGAGLRTVQISPGSTAVVLIRFGFCVDENNKFLSEQMDPNFSLSLCTADFHGPSCSEACHICPQPRQQKVVMRWWRGPWNDWGRASGTHTCVHTHTCARTHTYTHCAVMMRWPEEEGTFRGGS